MITVYNVDYGGAVTPLDQCPIVSPVAADWDLVAYDKAEDRDNIGPQLIIHSSSGLVSLYRACRDYRRRWGFVPFILGITGESFDVANLADCAFSHQSDSPNNYHYPLCLFSPYNLFHHNGVMTDINAANLPFKVLLNYKQADLQDDINLIKNSFPKQRFCNFIASYAKKKRGGAILRRDFAKRLLEYKQVDCAGAVLNNTDELQRESPRNACQSAKYDGLRGKLRYIAQYRFTIAFENISQPFYITEKITHPLIVGSIPIYWGAPNIAEFFNPACFINCHDYDSLEAVIERVKQIEADPDLYAQYLNAPKVLPDSRLYDYSGDKFKAKMNEVMRRVVAHQAVQRQWHWIDDIAYRLQHFSLEAKTVKKMITSAIGSCIPNVILAKLKR